MLRLTRSPSSLLLAALLWGGQAPDAQAAEALHRLAEQGYTDLGLSEVAGSVTVAFTNQTRRKLSVAIGEVLREVAQDFPAATRMRLIPQTHRQAIGFVEVDMEAYRRWSAGEMGDAEFLPAIHLQRQAVPLPERSASSRFLTDLAINPSYSLYKGLAFGLEERTHTNLGGGLGLETDFQQTLVGPAMPGVLGTQLTYFGWLFPSIPSVMRLGYFGLDGWGGCAEVGMPMGPVELQFLVGITDRTSPQTVARFYTRPGLLGLGLRGGIGRYLDGDWGYEWSAIRWFGNSSLEGTVLKTSNGVDIRAVLTLGGGDRAKSGWLRVEPWPWTVVYQPQQWTVARRLVMTDDLEGAFQQLYLDEVAAHVPRWPKLGK